MSLKITLNITAVYLTGQWVNTWNANQAQAEAPGIHFWELKSCSSNNEIFMRQKTVHSSGTKTCDKLWDVITHACINFKSILAKLPVKLGHGREITSHRKVWIVIVLFHNNFSPSGEQPEHRMSYNNQLRLYSNISQILLLYKMWGYYKFYSTKSLGVCYWCVQIPQCRHIENGLKYITFYVHLAMCYNPPLVHDSH